MMNRLNTNLYFWILIIQNFHSSLSFSANSILKNDVKTPIYNRHVLYGIAKSKVAVLDGASFNALDAFLAAEGTSTGKKEMLPPSASRHGYCTVITAKMSKERIIGMKVEEEYNVDSLEKVMIDSGVEIYKDSMATIPKSISDDDAISTFAASLVGIHCAFHDPISPDDKIVKNVGGSSVDFVAEDEVLDKKDNRKAVVVGGGDYASFVSDGLSVIGASVTQVSSNKMLRPRQQTKVSVSPPEGDNLGVGFASAVGKFDVLVDTLSDEGKAGESMCIGINNDWDDFSTENDQECSSVVIRELKIRHNCQRYISTMCKAQQMVRDNGLIFGRNDAVKYTKDIESNPRKPKANHILPPKKFGAETLQKLFNANILLKSNGNKASWSQGWSMKDYWELTTWPRDVTGAANVRFGFPVVDDLLTQERMISEPPKRASTSSSPSLPNDEFSDLVNPYIFQIDGIEDLSSGILNEKKKCVLFLSSPSCRTCKYLSPQYTNLSRKKEDTDVVFAKANAFSKKGKELSKVLSVDAVPAFVLFRDGQKFGNTLSISRIPSKQLNLALELLDSGEWDTKRMNELAK